MFLRVSSPTRRIMISSVMREFEAEREAIKNVVLMSGNHPVMAENRLSGLSVMEEVKRMVDDSDCYVGVFSERWGDVPPDNNPCKLSMTAMEFELAKTKGIPMRIFVSGAEKRDPELQAFLDRVGDSMGRWFIRYDSAADLFLKIGISVCRLVEEIHGTPRNLNSIKAAMSRHNSVSVSGIKDNVHQIYQEPAQFGLVDDLAEKENMWLVGERGIGKSVVLKKLVAKKMAERKNVLFLRSEDILHYGGLDGAVNYVCGTSLESALKMFGESDKLLLIVDSVEAIHRSPGAWENFTKCVFNVLGKPELRIAFSIRQSDYLAFGESFPPEWGTEIVLAGFTDDQIRRTLDAMQVSVDKSMFQILKHPFYLEILDSMAAKLGGNDLHLLSTRAKFIKLHYQRMVCDDQMSPEHVHAREEFLSMLADRMLKSKRLKLHYMNAASPEFKSLRSDGIITDDGTFVQFFHQLYFDFIMSMKIIDSGSVADYLKSVGGEPFLRSTVQFMLSYLHSEDFDLYESSMRGLIRDASVGEYWKRVAVRFMGQLRIVHDGEEDLVTELLDADASFTRYFLESAIESKNAHWLSLWDDSVLVEWAKDKNSPHGALLAEYVNGASRWSDEQQQE